MSGIIEHLKKARDHCPDGSYTYPDDLKWSLGRLAALPEVKEYQSERISESVLAVFTEAEIETMYAKWAMERGADDGRV